MKTFTSNEIPISIIQYHIKNKNKAISNHYLQDYSKQRISKDGLPENYSLQCS